MLHLLPKETGQIIHVILVHTVLVLLLLLILRVRKCRILHGFPHSQDGNVSFLLAMGSLCDQRGGVELPKTGTLGSGTEVTGTSNSLGRTMPFASYHAFKHLSLCHL